MIYLDHPATSWPKPPVVVEAMKDFLETTGANPGRSGHRLSIAAGRVVHEAREGLANFFGATKTDRVIFTNNATQALNMVIHTTLKPGDTVLTTSVEHNSVMRPLRTAEARGVRVLVAPCDPSGQIDLDAFRQLLSHDVRLVVMTHASNVIGRIMPVSDIFQMAHCAGAMTLLDAAQTAGVVPIRAADLYADFIAFTGHKSLQGPPGTGGLVICTDRAESEISTFMQGGTGSRSQSETHPEVLPDRLEAGTPNGVGIAGLGAAIRWICSPECDSLHQHQTRLIKYLIDGLISIPGVEVFGPVEASDRVPLVSFRIKGKYVSEVGQRLDDDYGILCRVGLHCAPAAHKIIGTFPEGVVRFGVGPFTSEEDVTRAIDAVSEIAADG
ncbi:MAG: aminotransferase class V-fold PLP-dependent enzyme [Armatimonadota bacterium]|jgi:cysteine desulfurase/selenocysteine lyase